MRKFLLAIAVLLAVMSCNVDAQVRRKRKRTTTPAPPTPEPPVFEKEVPILEEIFKAEKMYEDKFQEHERMRVNELLKFQESGDNSNDENEVFTDDPCSKVHCSAGRVCELNDEGEAVCNCIKECPNESDRRRMVCTNHNETWTSDCEVYQQHCYCMEGSELCKGDQYKHVQIDYYGPCKLMGDCKEEEMADFPRRMRDWLFNIMRELAERRSLTEFYLKMEQEAETNLTRRWTNAAIWKWCDLDAHDNDRFVSRHELFPIRAPLMSLEHCIGPFLNACDADDDHRITLAEWVKCLGLEEYDIEERCEEFTGNAE